MAGIAIKNGYQFLGILQPVLGVGRYSQPNIESLIEKGKSVHKTYHNDFYFKLIDYTKSDSAHLCDFTGIFDTVQRGGLQ